MLQDNKTQQKIKKFNNKMTRLIMYIHYTNREYILSNEK